MKNHKPKTALLHDIAIATGKAEKGVGGVIAPSIMFLEGHFPLKIISYVMQFVFMFKFNMDK